MLLLERESALTQLRSALTQAGHQGGKTLLVAGEAGIGKSTVVDAFANEQRRHCRVLWGACDALRTPRPLGPLVDMLGQLGDEVSRAHRDSADAGTIFSAFFADLAAHTQPSLILFEDVHWADHATLDLIKFLGRRIARLHAVLVLTYRDDEVQGDHPLRPVLADLPPAHVQHLKLSPLSREAVAQLAAQQGTLASGLYEKTNGNPFYVTELLASPDQTIPRTIQDAVLARLHRLSRPAMALCDYVSACPGQLDTRWLDAWPRYASGQADAALDECVRQGVLQLHGHALRFRHEIARLALHESLAPQQRRAVHAELLAVLRTLPSVGPARPIYHAALANLSDAVLELAPLAAQEAARLGAHREAAAHWAMALKHAQQAPLQTQAELNEAWSYEAGLAQTIDPAVMAARERAIALWRQLGNAQREGLNLRWLSRLHWYLGHKDEAHHFLDQAIEVLEKVPPCPELVMAYSMRSQMLMLNSHYQDAMAWGERALSMALTHDAPEARVHALNNLGTTRLMTGQTGGEAMLLESLALAQRGGFHEQAARAYTNLCATMVAQCRYAEAASFCAQGLDFDRQHDLDSWTYYLLGLYAQLCAERGQFAQAITLAEEALAVPAQTPVMRWPPSLALGLARSRSGCADALPLLTECLTTALAVGEAQLILPTCRALAEAHWLRGDLARAQDAVKLGWLHRSAADDPWLIGPLVVWAHRLGLLLDATVTLPAIYQLEISGNTMQAAQQWAALGASFEQAICLMGAGADGLHQAAQVFAELNATPALALARAQARQQGVRGIARGPYAAARDHRQGLTAREHQIHQLLCEGLSNAEISARLHRSLRTIEHHVSAVLTKLGVEHRADLRRRDAGLRLSASP